MQLDGAGLPSEHNGLEKVVGFGHPSADGAGLPSEHNGLEKVVGFGHPSVMVLDYHLNIAEV